MWRFMPWLLCAACVVDGDGDGFSGVDDCDDTVASTHVGAQERCDGVDNDCDGAVDEEAVDLTDWFADGDGDGSGSGEPVSACEAPPGHVSTADDCDDADPDRHPGAEEVMADGVDQDCDGTDLRPEKPAAYAHAEAVLRDAGYTGSFGFAGRGCCDNLTVPSRDGSKPPELALDADHWRAMFTSDRFVSGSWRLKGDVSCWVFPDEASRKASSADLSRLRMWFADTRVLKRPSDRWSEGSHDCVIFYPSPNRHPFAKEVAFALASASP
jgi:hypothetical protein